MIPKAPPAVARWALPKFVGPSYQTSRPTKLEYWSLTGEGVGGEASKGNDGKAERADDRKGGTQSTNAVNIANFEKRHTGPATIYTYAKTKVIKL